MSKLKPIALIFLPAVLSLAGCGPSNPWKIVYPAAGRIVFKGQPLSGAQIILQPKDPRAPSAVRPTATTDGEGRFQLGTYGQADGAPAGEYGVAVVWHPLANTGAGPVRGENKLPVRYAQFDSSQITVRIEKKATELPALELNP